MKVSFYFLQSPFLALLRGPQHRVTECSTYHATLGHLPWKPRLFTPYATMSCQTAPVCSAVSKFDYGMAGSTRHCSLGTSVRRVTEFNVRGAQHCDHISLSKWWEGRITVHPAEMTAGSAPEHTFSVIIYSHSQRCLVRFKAKRRDHCA